MSTTLSTTTMIAQLQARCPIGASASYCLDRLNEAFRNINQRASFLYQFKTTTVSTGGANTNTFAFPSDCDMGRDIVIVGPANWSIPIPYQPYEVATKRTFTDLTFTGTGQFGAWSYITNYTGSPPTYNYKGYLFPAAAAPAGATNQIGRAHV